MSTEAERINAAHKAYRDAKTPEEKRAAYDTLHALITGLAKLPLPKDRAKALLAERKRRRILASLNWMGDSEDVFQLFDQAREFEQLVASKRGGP